ncbi:MraY family glycosyltransferase [Kyrpidia tusciae]|uniref:Glycosyl transferase, family 4, conserved region n=1 Tax=Kyrpidia tusciae (strain DSM 2912 / NBRC 15312 / T2) TaxID=562970 RepID=D5WUX6_KYRT2|nr:MraY family glycosyltransferase [Kyrpidia tusciae]ADG07448.1 Glycosyl transferase, family 4, conserved region [Kyrpidia tusciae DSM 2912]
MAFLLAFAAAFAAVYGMVPVVRRFALKWGFVDMPNQRKIHKEPIPLMGGVALYVGFALAATAATAASPQVHLTMDFWGIVLGGLVIVATGLLDDGFKAKGRELSPWPKLIMQFVAAGILIAFGVQIKWVTIPFTPQGMYLMPDWLSIIATLLWVVAITNMINFLDGVDGLAAGIAAISSTTLFFVALIKDQAPTALYAATMIGVTLAFLKHNFHPAKIFMGDAGAMFLGFTLAAISVDGAFKSATLVSVLVPVLALGVPIFDTVYVIFKRLKDNRPIYVADKGHTFHLLMRSGMNQVQTVAFLYLLGICFSLASIVVLLAAR